MAEKNHGPMRGNARGPRPNVANPGKLLLRLLSYIFKNYGFACIVVVICLFITVFSSVQGTLFMQTLIDDYIIPLTNRPPLISRNSPMRSDALQFSMRVVCLLPLHSPKLWYTSHREHSGT